MKYLLIILSTSILLSGELEVDGDLKVTGTIQNDSLAQVIANLQTQISLLQEQVTCLNSGSIPFGYCDCFGNVLDACDICGGNNESEEECYSTVTDIDDNVYNTIKIGNKWWIAENLRTMHYKDGSPISCQIGNSEWLSADFGACNINYNATPEWGDVSNWSLYGNEYNWYAVDNYRGLCMDGWHIPNKLEYESLVEHLGSNAGEKIKDSELWNGTNESGFTAYPAGSSTGLWQVGSLGEKAYFWTSTENSVTAAEYIYLDSGNEVMFDALHKYFGYSVRCVKD